MGAYSCNALSNYLLYYRNLTLELAVMCNLGTGTYTRFDIAVQGVVLLRKALQRRYMPKRVGV